MRVGRDRLRRPYPDGMAIDLGVHWDGATGGPLLTLGSSDALLLTCDAQVRGRRLVLGIDESGALYAEGPSASRLSTTLARGTHLLSYRVTVSSHALYVDGVRVATGSGTEGVAVEFPERWSPAFVLGATNQRWWACAPSSRGTWLRSAPFFVHLRDDGNEAEFSLATAVTPAPATVLLFDAAGVRGSRWLPSHGVDDARWTEADREQRAGHAYGATWSEDVWSACLTR